MTGLNPKLNNRVTQLPCYNPTMLKFDHKSSTTQTCVLLLPEVEGKHPTIHQGFASDTHQERLELCNPSNRIEQAHLYS